ncbi:MAG TPA: histidinol dehydrogenase [Candidatus Limnocylindrales bacterium]|nr:histidinol dehydrogenase [Candidatus Limnocylindrales bacterium]
MATSATVVREAVATIVADVRTRGDVAVREFSERFDHWSPDSFQLGPEEIDRIVTQVPAQVRDDIKTAQANIRAFARAQRDSLTEFEIETLPGVVLGQRHIPVSAAGAYVPGGRYPLVASAHMTIVTAKVAGVERVVACTPPIDGEIPTATVTAMHLAGADEIYLLGGVQAIAAMALGTETIGRVDMLAGPGNAYVAEAKRQLFGEVGIDLLAGPTEILVVADASADPFVVAVDLLSQAEHGPDSPAILITTSEEVGRATMAHIDRLLPDMPTRDYAGPAWRDHGQVVVVEDLDQAYALADDFAFEHVEILTADPREALARLRNYGALFLGEGTTVSYGDKVIGTNHVLPTRSGARYTGGLWVGKYLKTVTYQEITNTDSSAALGELCGRASRVERFEGHARAGDVRVAKYTGEDFDWMPERAKATTR